MMVVNTETIAGYRVAEVKGIVQGNTVRAKHVGRDIAASFKNLVGGELKGYTELLGMHYAERGLEVVILRFGGVRLDDALQPEPGYHAFFLSRRDCAHAVERAVEAELPERYNVVFAVSRNEWRVHDIESARRIIGYEPTDRAEDFA